MTIRHQLVALLVSSLLGVHASAATSSITGGPGRFSLIFAVSSTGRSCHGNACFKQHAVHWLTDQFSVKPQLHHIVRRRVATACEDPETKLQCLYQYFASLSRSPLLRRPDKQQTFGDYLAANLGENWSFCPARINRLQCPENQLAIRLHSATARRLLHSSCSGCNDVTGPNDVIAGGRKCKQCSKQSQRRSPQEKRTGLWNTNKRDDDLWNWEKRGRMCPPNVDTISCFDLYLSRITQATGGNAFVG